MRVLLTTHRLDAAAGGLPAAVAGLADALDAAGLHVHLAAPATPDPVVPSRPGVHLELVNDVRAWRRFLDGAGVDLLHDHGLWQPVHLLAARAARRRGWPRLVSTHGMLAPVARRHHGGRKRLAWALWQRRALAAAQALHASTEAEAADVRGLLPGRPLVVVPHGVALPPVLPAQTRGEGPRRALYLGRLHPLKGPQDLLAAWGLVRPEGWVLDVAGPDVDGFRAALERQVREAGLGAAVRFLGPVEGEEKARAFGAADLVVLPSRTESFGLAAAEALAYGLPVIANQQTPWETLEAAGAGWWVPPGVAGLADGLRMATALDDAARRAVGARGRRLAETRFAWPQVARRMAAAYAWLLGGPRPDDVRDGPGGGPAAW